MQSTYYGEQTKKAIKNFPFNVYKFHKEFIRALVQIKKAAAMANFEAGNFSREIKNAIVRAADEVLEGKIRHQFPLPGLQGGAGTSINMNVNEVLAGRATEILNKTLTRPSLHRGTLSQRERGAKIVHPNDHVNRSQSTNDVNPSAIKVASLDLIKNLEDTLDRLVKALEQKAVAYKNVVKLARTHLQDAVPTTLGAEFAAYAEIIRRHKQDIDRVRALGCTLNLGGTAIGNSVNASPKYLKSVYRELSKITRHEFRPAKNLMAFTSSQSDFLAMSQAVTSLCMDCSKIASDLRLMSSGPRGGLGEITLQELQNGSSIMPGKNNPVMPETVNQLYFLVSGNNLSIEHAAHAAQLELGVMFPTIADRLLQSFKIASEVLDQFTKKCVVSIKANKQKCKEHLENSTAYAALLTPKLGYETMSQAVKEAVASGKTLREIVVGKKLLSNKEFDDLIRAFRV